MIAKQPKGDGMPNDIVLLNAQELRAEIEKKIMDAASGNYEMNHSQVLFSTIDRVADDTLKVQLLKQYLSAMDRYQDERNFALREEVKLKIWSTEQLIKHGIHQEDQRNRLFNSRPLLMFLWCFPVFVGFAAVKYLESFTFAVFIVTTLYGVLISLWFSKSTGLSETLSPSSKKKS